MNNLLNHLFPFISEVVIISSFTPDGFYLNPESFDKKMGNKFQIIGVNQQLTEEHINLLKRRGAKHVETFELKKPVSDKRIYTSYVYELETCPK